MKTSSSPHLFRAPLAFLALTAALLAQEPPAPAPKSAPSPTAADNPATTAAPAAPAAAAATENDRAAAQAATAPEAAPAARAAPAAPSEAAATDDADKAKMRRLDEPNAAAAPAEPARRRRGDQNVPFGNHAVAREVRIHEAVSIMGSTSVEGQVDSDAVSVMGDTRIASDAKVGGDAVAVLGRLESRGEIGGDAVAVLGGAYIDGRVGGEIVSVLGNVELGPKADVGGVVVVGGALKKDPSAVVRGEVVQLGKFGPLGDLDWLTTWFRRCLLLGRPLAFGPNLAWAWAVAFAFLAFYLLLALLFPGAIVKCAQTLETRPGSSIVASVLTVLLTPVALVLLAVTVIGAVLVPFVAAALLVAGLFGKAVMLGWIGRRFTKYFGDGVLGHAVFSVLIGGLLVMLLYTVWGSFLLYKLLSWLGTGVVVYTIVLSMRREKPAAAVATGAGPAVVPPVGHPGAMSGEPRAMAMSGVAASETAGAMSAGFVGGGGVATETIPPAIGALPEAAVVPPRVAAPLPPLTAISLPRAELFIRLAALLLDVVLVGVVTALLNGPLPRPLEIHFSGFLLLLAAYGAVMWKTKGTTIGGIVCSLKVVRVDNREIDWATAIVRAVSCFLSMIVAGLGFIWIAIDDEKQSWHDKIAGTAVVRVPKGVSLL